MSGICGILRFGGDTASERDVARMANAMAYRAPDRRKIAAEGSYAVAHLLMRTMREDAFDQQPVRDGESNLLLVADARIDNREELAGHLGIDADRLAKLADSSLILKAYQRWGEDCAERLVGDFAFAVWDRRARKLVLGRDHMGQRGAYYHRGDGFFAFASDLKALWALADVPRALDEDRIAGLLLADFRPKDSNSLCAGIKGIAAGAITCVGEDGSFTERRFWTPHADPAHLGHNEAYYVKTYRAILGEAVACRLRRTLHPASLWFGGGFDSGAIAGLARPVVEAQGRKLVCVSSIAPPGHRGPIKGAKHWIEICRRHMPHIDVHYLTREGTDVLSDIERAFVAAETPVGPNRYCNDLLFDAAAAAGARVVMDGFGGDYTVNHRGSGFLAYLLRTGKWRRFLTEWRPHLRRSGENIRQTLKQTAFRLIPTRARLAWEWAANGFRPFYDSLTIAGPRARALLADGAVPMHILRAQQFGFMRGAMVEILNYLQSRPSAGGNIAASHGLEFTQPYHDKRVVEFALAIPEELYVKNGRNRNLACQALRDVYPPEFQTRGRQNDDRIPDFLDMALRVRPAVLRDVDRMAGNPKLARLVDFGKVRRLLDEAATNPRANKAGVKATLGLQGFLVARYVEWFQGYNT